MTLTFLICGSAGLILVGGYFKYVIKVSKHVLIYSISGHVQVGKKGFFQKGKTSTFGYLLPDYQKIMDSLLELPEIKFVIPRIYFGGMASHHEANISTVAIGVDPLAEKKVLDDYQSVGGEKPLSILEGRDLDPDDPYGILLEEDLQSGLDAKVGDSVVLLAVKEEGSIDGADFHVRGIYRSTSKEMGSNKLKMPLATAQKLLGIPGKVHTLNLVLKEEKVIEGNPEVIQQKLKVASVPTEIIPWRRFSPLTRQGDLFLKRLYFHVQIIIGFVFMISVINTINMSLFERMREYGTMMALGNGKNVIFGSIVFEGIFLGILGGLGGLLFSFLLAKMVGVSNIRMPDIPGAAEGTISYVRFYLTLPLFIGVFLMTFLTTVLASVIPAFRVSRWPIVKALGYV